MFACNTVSHMLAVKVVQCCQVFREKGFNFVQFRWRHVLTGTEEVLNFAKYPGASLSCSSDKQAVRTGMHEHIPCLLR